VPDGQVHEHQRNRRCVERRKGQCYGYAVSVARPAAAGILIPAKFLQSRDEVLPALTAAPGRGQQTPPRQSAKALRNYSNALG